jgi:hypothetical protein
VFTETGSDFEGSFEFTRRVEYNSPVNEALYQAVFRQRFMPQPHEVIANDLFLVDEWRNVLWPLY